MSFNSPIFLFFFLPGFMLLYYLSPGRVKILSGIAGGIFFYAWGSAEHLPLLIGLTLLTYFIGLAIGHWQGRPAARALLWGGIILNIGMILYYKLKSDLPYPLGLSFLTFQAIAYLAEIQNKVTQPEKNILHFSFYLLLFPKITAGPITRYKSIQQQIQTIQVSWPNAADGLRRFISGLAKKVLIADTLAAIVNPVFNLPAPDVNSFTAWLVLFGYALQLYFDFSGYSDMAIGLGRMMGFTFIENFNYPYIAKNVSDFWRRWHISLSSWFRDFVFYPLERKRIGFYGQQINMLIVFLLTGLWHGLTINYVIWGLIHGAAIVFESTNAGRKLRGAWAPLQHLYLMGVILTSWVFFRSPSLEFALEFFGRLAGKINGIRPLPFSATHPLPFLEPSLIAAFALAVIFALPTAPWMQKQLAALSEKRAWLRLPIQLAGDGLLIALLFASLAAASSATFIPSIYGKF